MGSRIVPAAAAIIAASFAARAQTDVVAPSPGMVVDRSMRIRPGRYRLPSSGLDHPALVVRGSDITLDLTGVTIEGGDPEADPDTYGGLGILVDGASSVTIRGGAVRGFKVGILARHAPGVHVTGADLSYNWKPRLLSGIEKENEADWLYFHNNEHDEWLRYGAAIYVSDSDEAEVDHTRAVQGMNGLMVVRSARLNIWNNTFSWLSGVGIGFYRTTDSAVMHNRLDWCVRGYSHGFYNRGQDSAGLLMYEQSSRNTVAYNSITHGGDGVFLWAGQSTMDTGRGGANDNVFYDNDVSSAVANGIEATFSRNVFVANRIDDCWHGIWGGYSFDSVIAANRFSGNTDAIAIEHGQNVAIRGNVFRGDETAIRLWANAKENPDWPYARLRDTRSRDYLIAENRFEHERTAVNLTRTAGVRVAANTYLGVARWLERGPGVQDVVEGAASPPAPLAFVRPEPIVGASDAKLPPNARRGRATIIVDEWGPYDYLSPKLWPAGRPGDRPLRLRVLGPAGRWRLKAARNAAADRQAGKVPGEVVVTPQNGAADFQIQLEYAGGAVVSPRGRTVEAGTPYLFSYPRD